MELNCLISESQSEVSERLNLIDEMCYWEFEYPVHGNVIVEQQAI